MTKEPPHSCCPKSMPLSAPLSTCKPTITKEQEESLHLLQERPFGQPPSDLKGNLLRPFSHYAEWGRVTSGRSDLRPPLLGDYPQWLSRKGYLFCTKSRKTLQGGLEPKAHRVKICRRAHSVIGAPFICSMTYPLKNS